MEGEDESDPMLGILFHLGLGDLYPQFVANKVGPREVELLSPDDFGSLGVQTIGDRARLKQSCKDYLKGQCMESPVVQTFLELKAKGRYGTRRKEKATTKMYVGWKHAKGGAEHVTVHPARGGGQRKLDVQKNCSLEELKSLLSDIYFPDGSSISNGITLNEVDCTVVTFSGHPLPEMVKDQPFTVGVYCDSQKSTPIRIYLQTRKLSDTPPTPEQSTSTGTEQPTQPVITAQSPNLSDSDFEEAGTPTVCVRRRNLSLRRQRHSEQGHAETVYRQHTVERRPDTHIQDEDSVHTVYDSEDEELERAVAASLVDCQATDRTAEPTLQLTDLLQELHTKVNGSTKQEIIVSRRNVLESAFRALRRHFDTTCNLYVKFSGEMGLDHGGPRREFFRLVLQEVCSSPLFEGKEGAKFFSHDIKRLDKNEYQLAGKIVAMSIVHVGPGLHTLNEALGRLMLGLHPSLQSLNIEELPNAEVRDILRQLKNIEQHNDVERFLVDHGDWLMEQGYCGWRMTVEQKEEVYESVLKQIIFYRTSAEICQFIAGMEEVFGLWTVMKSNPELCLPLLCHEPQPLSTVEFLAICQTLFSEEGSNRRQQEEDTIYSWEIFLQEIEDNVGDVTFDELLAFVSGADKIPPCGFPSKIDIEFFSYEDGCKRLPFTSTCALTLSLPRGIANPDEFRLIIIRSLRESLGFEKM